MVFGSHAKSRAIYSTPPCPSLAASTAAYRRRSFSDSHPKNRCIFCSTSAVYTSMPHSLIQDLLRGKDTTASAIRKVILHHILKSQRSLRCITLLHPSLSHNEPQSIIHRYAQHAALNKRERRCGSDICDLCRWGTGS